MNNEERNQNRNQNRKRSFGPFENGDRKPTFSEGRENVAPVIGLSQSENPAPVIGLGNSKSETRSVEKTSTFVVVDNCSLVNVREQPRSDAMVITTATKGARFKLISQTSGWAKVESIEVPTWIGYIMDAYVVGE